MNLRISTTRKVSFSQPLKGKGCSVTCEAGTGGAGDGRVVVRTQNLCARKGWVEAAFGGLEVTCWPLVGGFAPGRSRRIFRAKKILSTSSFGEEVKPSVPCRNFTACKRSLNVTWKPAFRQISRTFLAHSCTFRRWVLSHGDTHGDAWWRKLECLTQIAQ
jgi:hypothetical protein